eukprot:5668-Heterococcus_DN1.PRE.3
MSLLPTLLTLHCTYPGGAPISLDTANFSMYSLMSIRMRASSCKHSTHNTVFHNALAECCEQSS